MPTSEGWIVFTDGACSGNPGPGGWAAIIVSPNGEVCELGGAGVATTNNRMELTAAIEAFKKLSSTSGPVAVYADSTYVILGITSWISGWKYRGWVTSEKKPVFNRDLWEKLDALARDRSQAGKVSWHHVKGHSGSPGNERCDEIAVGFAQGAAQPLYCGPLSGYSIDIMDLAQGKKHAPHYLSLVDGRLERHDKWPDCQARVKGRTGARFKKVFSTQEEIRALKSWGLPPES